MYSKYTRDQIEELIHICERFIYDNKITCKETIYQVDRVEENALEFIGEICEVVGYKEVDNNWWDDDDDKDNNSENDS